MSSIDPIITYLRNCFYEFGYLYDVDERYFALLQQEFPDVDILEQLKIFHMWTLDAPQPVKHMRMRFRNWVKNSQRF